MAKTAIGLFESAAKAEQALQELLSRGFARGEIKVITTATTTTTSAGTSPTRWLEVGGLPDEDAEMYLEGIRRGSALVAVESAERAGEAAEIMDRLGALDVDQLASSWKASGWVRPMTRAAGRGMSPPGTQDVFQTGRSRSAGGGARVFVW